jgi:predicted NBD/HSP70 family sugar kinase
MAESTELRGTDGRRPNPLRELSEQEVLETIFRSGPVTRPEIAEQTGLSKATVGAVVDRLERGGMVHSNGPQHGRRGRSPLAYEVRANAGFVLGIDIGATKIQAAAADIFGKRVLDEHQPTSRDGGRAVTAQVLEIATRVAERARTTHERLLSAAVSTPGVVDQVSRRVTSLAYNVSPDGGLDPAAALRARFDVPVLIENDVNLAAVGESWEGLAHGISTFAFVHVDAGVGMGLVIDGNLVRGAHGAAGEIGYLPIGTDPYDERHRLHGGLEDEIGAAGIVAAFAARARDQPTPISPKGVFELATSGDPNALAVLGDVARRLGAAIASVAAVVDPDLIVLGGATGGDPGLLPPVRATVAELVALPARIESSKLGDLAALHGAIAIALGEARSQLFMRAGR